jgi:hypothetical protein
MPVDAWNPVARVMPPTSVRLPNAFGPVLEARFGDPEMVSALPIICTLAYALPRLARLTLFRRRSCADVGGA